MPRGWALPLVSTPQSPKPPNPPSHGAASSWQWVFLVPAPPKKTVPRSDSNRLMPQGWATLLPSTPPVLWRWGFWCHQLRATSNAASSSRGIPSSHPTRPHVPLPTWHITSLPMGLSPGCATPQLEARSLLTTRWALPSRVGGLCSPSLGDGACSWGLGAWGRA